MGSGSFLGRKTLVHFPDVFLFSPQFLHRALSLSNKVNKWSISEHKCFLCSPSYVKGVSLGHVGEKLKSEEPKGTVGLDPRDPLLPSERTQGFAADPVY